MSVILGDETFVLLIKLVYVDDLTNLIGGKYEGVDITGPKYQ